MKKSNLYSRYLIAFLFSVLIFHFGCKKEKGYYSTPNINAGTTLDTYDYLKSKPGVYDSLLLLIDELGMEQTLRDSDITLFAVSNASFQIALKNLNDSRKLKNKSAVFLSELASGKAAVMVDLEKAKNDSAHLDTMVSRYIIKGPYKSTDFSVGDGQNIYSVRGDYPMHGKRLYADAEGMQNGGPEIIEFANTKRSVFVPNWALSTTSSVNIKTKNGLVHLLEPNHVFGFDEFVRRLTFIPPPTNLFKKVPGTYTVQFKVPGYIDGSVSPGEKYVKLFDGNVLTKFICDFLDLGNNPLGMTWAASEPVVANVYTMTSANDEHRRDPRSWKLEGSLDDGVNWVILDTRQDIDFESFYQTKIFDFPNEVAYKHYRLTILSNHGDGRFQMAEWTMNFRQVYK